MKKLALICITLCMIILSSCTNNEKTYKGKLGQSDTITYSAVYAENTDRLQKFTDNIDAGNKDRINLVRFTTKGDPIITQLYYNGKLIEITVDNSQDRSGSNDKDKIIHQTINDRSKLKEALLTYLNSMDWVPSNV